MDSDTLHTCFLAAPVHFVREEMFGSREESFVPIKHISGIDEVLQILTQKIGDWNFSLAFLRLWRSDNIFSIKTLIGFVDINLFCRKIDICSGKRQ